MIAFALTGLIIGVILGLRFKVLVLVPVTVLAALATVAVGVNGSQASRLIIMWTVVVSLCLQMGYVLGAWAIADLFSPHRSRLRLGHSRPASFR
jgi:hypothetical protein